MILRSADTTKSKGWFCGPWDSSVPVAASYANEGIRESHWHEAMHEIYLVARGESRALVNGIAVALKAGDMLAVEPGETHTFLDSSEDYLHFVIQAPFVAGDKVLEE